MAYRPTITVAAVAGAALCAFFWHLRPGGSSPHAAEHADGAVSAAATPALASEQRATLGGRRDPKLKGMRVGELLVADVAEPLLVRELVWRLRHGIHGDEPAWETAAHLANIAPDADYGEIAELLAEGRIDEAALDVLIGDAHHRGPAVKLPLFAKISENPIHPARDEALALLQMHFETPETAGDAAAWRRAAYREAAR